MRLRRLTIQGYKSFAGRTEFLFDDHITAVIGPNGSGKSNIADALRWVLGEQSHGLLRSRRTSDLIFGGTDGRSRVGMAEATVTLENDDGSLPIEYREVAITRRAYRSGENEYYLNGARVRLRDVVELLAEGGLNRLTYAVIGQGMIDAALSWSPAERRRLFEEAAGITIYQSKREEALRRLDETAGNVTRVRDVMSELEPQLRRLAVQAEQATRLAELEAELRRLQERHFGERLRQARATAEADGRRAAYLEARLRRQLAELQEFEAAAAELSARERAGALELDSWRREGERLSGALASAERQVAVLRERERATTQRLSELGQEVRLIEDELAEAAGEERAAAEEGAALDRSAGELQADVARLQESAQERRRRRLEGEQRLRSLQEALAAALTARTEAASRCRSAEQRRRELERLVAEAGARADALSHDQAARAAALQEAGDRLAAAQTGAQEAQRLLEQRREQHHEARGALQRLRRELAAADEDEQRLKARLAMLARVQQESLYPGVRAVLDMAAAEGDGGILGAAGSLLQVPPHLEEAIEATLGSRLQQVVVRSWPDAERAIAYLKQRRAGRVTFLPLDTLRPPSPLSLPRIGGVIGVAADMVAIEPGLEPVLRYLLNRVVIVQDLAAARVLLGRVGGSYTATTLEGDVAQSSGSVTGGGERRVRSAILERERERRALPAEAAAVRRRRQDLGQQAQALAEQVRLAAEAETAAEEAVRRARAAVEALQRQEARLRLEAQQGQEQSQWQARRREELRREDEGLAATATEAGAAAEEARCRVEELSAQAQTLERLALERPDGGEAHLEAQQATLKSLQERLAQTRAVQTLAHQRLERLGRRLDERRSQAQTLAAGLEAVRSEAAEAEAARDQYQQALDRLRRSIEPAGAAVQRLESQRLLLQREERARRQWHIEFGRTVGEAVRLAGRSQDAVAAVQAAAAHELGEDADLEALMAAAHETPPPARLEERIAEVRRRCRAIGQVNPNAPQERAALKERYDFLAGQADDLEGAAGSLRRVIAELEQSMHHRFTATFTGVARRFGAYFEELFAGGSARLQLTNPDDLAATGIDITVRPPGKRSQDLAALSGGERALTSTALLFALLEASDTPFCLVDEVDAMLDEANVGRFRRVMQRLSQRTQFVIISHNRATIEAAGIVYGITMGNEGTSRVLSLRMNGQETATAT